MKTAVNAPIPLPEYNLGSMYYGLLHEMMGSDQLSNQYLKTVIQQARHPQKELILDNGADELGESPPSEKLYEYAKEILPTYLILPDKLKDPKTTRERSEGFYKEYGKELRDRGLRFMYVVQGTSYEEWMNEYNWALNFIGTDLIGVPYDIDFSVPTAIHTPEGVHKSVHRGRNREALLRTLERAGLLVHPPIHLLGMNNLVELRRISSLHLSRFIYSTDSTAPFAAAQFDRVWSQQNSGWKDWPPLDFRSDILLEGSRYNKMLDNLLEYFVACGDVEAVKNLYPFMHKSGE